MLSRRSFLKISAALGAVAGLLPGRAFLGALTGGRWGARGSAFAGGGGPVVISTWRHGVPANDAAWKVLSGGGSALDAVEAGVMVPEGDPEVTSVGACASPETAPPATTPWSTRPFGGEDIPEPVESSLIIAPIMPWLFPRLLS